MKFIVTTPDALGNPVPLRGTIWAFDMDRAQKFDTREGAEAALKKAAVFNKRAAKKARILEVEG